MSGTGNRVGEDPDISSQSANLGAICRCPSNLEIFICIKSAQ